MLQNSNKHSDNWNRIQQQK